MYHTQVELMDALVAAQLVGTGNTNDAQSSVTGCPFPEDPMALYRKEGKLVNVFFSSKKSRKVLIYLHWEYSVNL